jgi:hypothetical protein
LIQFFVLYECKNTSLWSQNSPYQLIFAYYLVAPYDTYSS